MQAFVPCSSFLPQTAVGRPLCRASPLYVGTPITMMTSSVSVRGSPGNPYRIAVLPGDGIGPSVADAVKKVLNALTTDTDIHFEFMDTLYGAEAYEKTGSLVPDSTLSICREADAVLRSYQGTMRGMGPNGSAHRQLRDKLGLFAQFRPVVVYPTLASLSTLKTEAVADVDMMLVREISAGALGASEREGDGELTRSEVSYTEHQIESIAEMAFHMAEQRSGRILNVDKADAMAVSRFWRRILHESMDKAAKQNEGIMLTDMYVDDFVREVIHHPSDFDVVVTSNLFGDICAEVIDALAGPQRTSPSGWKSRDGLGVYGPADIYNIEAYPQGSSMKDTIVGGGTRAIALTRAVSMMLRYELDEPAAANVVQTALRKTMEDMVEEKVKRLELVNGIETVEGNGGVKGRSAMAGTGAETDADEFADVMVRSMQLLKQFEQVCDPTECGE